MLTSCRLAEQIEKQSSNRRFEGYVSGDKFFRLDTINGTLHVYTQGSLISVPSGPSKLVVGQLYDDENGKTILYQGGGVFNQSYKKNITVDY